MKKVIIATVISALAAGAAHAADVSASVDFASAYIFRGVTLNNGAVMQPGLEISGFPMDEKYGSLAIGTWANFDLSSGDGAVESGEFSEVDFYISYTLPVEVVDLGIGYTEYTYPSGGGDADRELNLSLGKALGDSGLYASAGVNLGVDGAIQNSTYCTAGLEYGTDLSESLSLSTSVTVGYLFVDEGSDGFNDVTASVGLSYALTERLALNGSLVYVGQLDDDVLTDEAYDREGFASIGLSYDF